MAWYIEKDFTGDDDVGQFNCNFKDQDKNTLTMVKKVCKHKFRMYDDDDELYYQGYSNDSSSFAPLDDFGMPNAGCTDIRYWENGKWEAL